MTYQQTIDYLFERLPMYSRIGAAAYKEDMTNTIKLCEAIGNLHTKFKSVHIAGTNGKGSVSHMLSAIFQTAGYKTGLYTSPHLKDFRERITMNGEFISEDFIIDFVKRMLPLIDEIEPSFFEITVAMAFEYFAQQQVDIAIIEVGLGGRLDSTNIITPELSVITNISYDHVNLLGDTLQKIAFEKAGIIKNNIPVVIGEFNNETHDVFKKKAAEENAPLTFADKKRFVAEWKFEKKELVAEVTSVHNNEKDYYHLDLIGIYQIKNLVTVLEAVNILEKKGWNITEAILQKALRNVKKLTGLHGRWEIIHEHPTVVLDVAHNEGGIRQLTEQIEITDHEELHLIIGMVKDKDIEKILSLLPKHASYYFTKAQIPRALPEQQLAEMAAAIGLQGDHYPDVNTALRSAINVSGKKDLIVICGSVFVVGEVELMNN
ncbi:MAG TPA: folylpolyglutamate synthase/dihydrofolate synthase family protein [Puia sp.]|jgi:dihydrofolate synthase/folylpolyglutamate synthase|nr:folylpolyglutamate synthase/dihydrofolate synthase family protein [Puia sp.]